MNNRLVWVDYIKAIGITAVVFGHTRMPDPVGIWIFSFHMPLFFIISGVLLANKGFDGSLGEFCRKRLGGIVYSYFVFAAIGLAHLLITRKMAGGAPGSLLELFRINVVSIVYASGTPGSPFTLYPVVLWFFPALISGLLLLFIIKRYFYRFRLPLCVVSLLLGLVLKNMALPWEFETGLCAVFFIFIGSEFSAFKANLSFSPKSQFALGMTLLSAGGLLSVWNGRIDFLSSHFGNILIAIPSCLFTMAGFYLFFHKVQPSKLITRISKATLIIFPTHMLVFSAFDFIALDLCRVRAPALPYELMKGSVTFAATLWISPYLIRILRLNAKKPPDQNLPSTDASQ